MTTKTPLQIALDERIARIVEQIGRLRHDSQMHYLADVCQEHANTLAELALLASRNDVGGSNATGHLLASLGALSRDMSRVETADTGLTDLLAAALLQERRDAQQASGESGDDVLAVDTITLSFATRLARLYPHFDAVAFLRAAGADPEHDA
jgi:hypothetical protein